MSLPEKPTPQELAAVAMLVDNASRQLHALAQGMVRVDLVDDVPRLETTARNAAKLARDSLTVLLERLGAEPKKQRPHKIPEPTDCPWTLTRAAVRKYRNQLGRHMTEADARAQLRAMSQAIVRPDIDENLQRPATLGACKLARESIEEVERMLKAPSAIAEPAPASMQTSKRKARK